MICKICYFNPAANAYTSRRYTYKSDLPLKVGDPVIAPTSKGEKNRAIVMETDLPDTVIDEQWADRVLYITEYDTEEEAAKK